MIIIYVAVSEVKNHSSYFFTSGHQSYYFKCIDHLLSTEQPKVDFSAFYDPVCNVSQVPVKTYNYYSISSFNSKLKEHRIIAFHKCQPVENCMLVQQQCIALTRQVVLQSWL